MELGEYNWAQGLTLKWNLFSAPWKDYCLTLKTYQHSIKLIYIMFSTLNDPRHGNNGSYIFWIFLGVFSQAFNKFVHICKIDSLIELLFFDYFPWP